MMDTRNRPCGWTLDRREDPDPRGHRYVRHRKGREWCVGDIAMVPEGLRVFRPRHRYGKELWEFEIGDKVQDPAGYKPTVDPFEGERQN